MTSSDTAGELRRAGLPAHPRYETTLLVFRGSPGLAMTAEEVYGVLFKADARANFIGVYRIVQRLCEAGFLKKSLSPKSHGRPKYVFVLSEAAAQEDGLQEAPQPIRKNLLKTGVLRRC